MKTKHLTIVIALMLASLPLAQAKEDMRRSLDKGDMRRVRQAVKQPPNSLFLILKTLIFGK